MTWITPFDARMLILTTFAVRFSRTVLPRTLTRIDAPLTVVIRVRRTTFPAVRRPDATWYVSTAFNCDGSFASASSVDFGTFAKAAFVGPKTETEHVDSVARRPASCTNPTSVENCGSDAAACTIVLSDCAL